MSPCGMSLLCLISNFSEEKSKNFLYLLSYHLKYLISIFLLTVNLCSESSVWNLTHLPQ